MCKACPLKLFVGIFVSIAEYVLETITSVWLLQYVVASIESGIYYSEIIYRLAFIMIVCGAELLLKCYYENCIKEKGQVKLRAALEQLFFDKAVDLDIEMFECSEHYTKVARATYYVKNISEKVFVTTCNTAGFFAMAISTAILLGNIDPRLMLFSLMGMPAAFAAMKYREVVSKQRREMEDSNRKKQYVGITLLKRECAQEMKTTDIGAVLNQIDEEAVNANVGNIKFNSLKLGIWSILRDLFMIDGVRLLCFIYVLYRLFVENDLQVSEFAVVFTAVMALVSRLRRIIENISSMKEYSIYAKDMEEFMKECPKVVGTYSAEEEFHSLSVEQISFAYNEKLVLKNISFDIKAGEKICIVGKNGSGKSTLIKLILRLYDPNVGEIKYNGKNIRGFLPHSYREHFSTVFQDYKLFSMSIGDNISMGGDVSDFDIKSAIKFAGLEKKLSDVDIHSMVIGREYDDAGMVFSVGEQQKLAIARMRANSKDIYVLDEPSSALDPIAEDELFKKMQIAALGKTTIFVSHRLSSVKYADKILVLDDGVLVESGTHDELMLHDGTYAKLFKEQAAYYIDSQEEVCEYE